MLILEESRYNHIFVDAWQKSHGDFDQKVTVKVWLQKDQVSTAPL